MVAVPSAGSSGRRSASSADVRADGDRCARRPVATPPSAAGSAAPTPRGRPPRAAAGVEPRTSPMVSRHRRGSWLVASARASTARHPATTCAAKVGDRDAGVTRGGRGGGRGRGRRAGPPTPRRPVAQQQEGEPDHREPLRRIQAVEVGRQGGASLARQTSRHGSRAAGAAPSGVHRRIRIRSVPRIDDGHRTGGARVRPGSDEHPGSRRSRRRRTTKERVGAPPHSAVETSEVCDVAHHRHGVGDGMRGRGETREGEGDSL